MSNDESGDIRRSTSTNESIAAHPIIHARFNDGIGRNKFDNGVYSKKLYDGSYMYLFLYADDLLIANKNIDEIINLNTLLESEIEIRRDGIA
ncbi:hypothetical protein LXL04_024851 [Taraxacum kok-saghyz]